LEGCSADVNLLSKGVLQVTHRSKNELVTVPAGFDYAVLESKVADQMRSAAKSIREKVKRTIESIIEVGNALLRAKDALPHGQFGPWLASEFGWTDRMARRFMDVAEVFGPKSDIISDLAIVPTAAYLLAAPSTPYEARQIALDRAQSGERITPDLAKEIVGAAKIKPARKRGFVPLNKLSLQLARVIDVLRERCDPQEVRELARQLREFVKELEGGKVAGKRGGRTHIV
jgi:Protein of unknown function (DUF3102)